jgi:hypothetical protein
LTNHAQDLALIPWHFHPKVLSVSLASKCTERVMLEPLLSRLPFCTASGNSCATISLVSYQRIPLLPMIV